MTNQTDVLARVYSYILSAEWGAKDTENKEADRQCFGNIAGDRLDLTDRGGRPAINDSVTKIQGGSQEENAN